MKIGTKSVLFGYHAFWLHPFLVAEGWRRLYGFPFDPRLWAAFFLHDIGYLGKPNMDGKEGEAHPEMGAKVMHFLFDEYDPYPFHHWCVAFISINKWRDLCLFHSRCYAAKARKPISKLCYADKLAFMLYPKWLLKILYALTGEWEEYKTHEYKTDDPAICYMGNGGYADFDEWYHVAWLRNSEMLKKGGFPCL